MKSSPRIAASDVAAAPVTVLDGTSKKAKVPVGVNLETLTAAAMSLGEGPARVEECRGNDDDGAVSDDKDSKLPEW